MIKIKCKKCGETLGRSEDQLHRKSFYCRNVKCGDNDDDKTLFQKLADMKRKVMNK